MYLFSNLLEEEEEVRGVLFSVLEESSGVDREETVVSGGGGWGLS